MSNLKPKYPPLPLSYTPQTIDYAIDYLDFLRKYNKSSWVILQFHYRRLTIQYKAFDTWVQIIRVAELDSKPIDRVVKWDFTSSSISQFKSNLREFFQFAESTYLTD